jgi:hypothetical protein
MGDVPNGRKFRAEGERGHSFFLGTRWSGWGGTFMSPKSFLALAVLMMVAGLVLVEQRDARAGEVSPAPGYKVLEPIRHGNLTVFPVVAAKSYPTGEFLTLDEGLRSGEVVVTEAGNVQGLIRRNTMPAIRHDGAQVNRLVLVNNSKRPLLLLAGEIVTGSSDRQRPHRSTGERSCGPERILRGAGAVGRDQPEFRGVRSHVRWHCGWACAWSGTSSDGDDGATVSPRQGHG